MSRRRRAILLLGLALALGALAAADVARRERAVAREIGPPVAVVVTRHALARGARLTPADLALRRVPARFAPSGGFASSDGVLGLRAAVAVPAGADLAPGELQDLRAQAPDGTLRRGERVAQVVGEGSPALVAAGARVDVLVTRGGDGGAGGQTTLALQDVEVLASSSAPPADGGAADGPRVAASLRVTLRQAVYLAAAQSFASELRFLPRAPGDRARTPTGLTIGSKLVPPHANSFVPGRP